MEVRSEFDSVTTPRPYWKCLMYAPSSRAFKVPPRVEPVGRTWALSAFPPGQAPEKNGPQVWTCRPPGNLKVYKNNNHNIILARQPAAAYRYSLIGFTRRSRISAAANPSHHPGAVAEESREGHRNLR